MQLKDYSVTALTGCRVITDISVGEFARLPYRPDIYTGIEIEAEGFEFQNGAHLTANTLGWDISGDDSLRSDGVEFVLKEPLNGERLASAVTGLFREYEEDRMTWHASPRAGTHFHLNVSNKNIGFVQALTALAYCVDELIFRFAGEDRRWCSYCNSLNTLPVNVLQALLVDREFNEHYGWGGAWPVAARDRYYGFNVSSVGKFGSLELRYFPTPTRETQVWDWLDLCHKLYEMAEVFEDKDNPALAVVEAVLENTREMLADIGKLPQDAEALESVREAAEELLTILTAENAREQHTAAEAVGRVGISLEDLLSLSTSAANTGESTIRSVRSPYRMFDNPSTSYFDEDDIQEEF